MGWLLHLTRDTPPECHHFYPRTDAVPASEDSKPRKRGRPQKTPRSSGEFVIASESLPTPASQSSPTPQQQTPQTKSQNLPQPIVATPTRASPPSKVTPKSNVKALPTVRDHTSDQLGPEGDEYIPREYDEAGEKKVDELGYLTGNRSYRCRTFTVPGRGDKLFMLATECARVLTYRDSYLLFNKNRSLYKIIASQKEKEDLISQDILPFSYRSRQIAIVTARSMFRQFGSRVIVNGRRVRDDYWESKARKQGFTEEDAAGEKRPGATRAREAAAAEAHAGTIPTFAHGDVVYSNGPGFDGMQPPALHPGIAATMAPLPMINIATDDIRFRDISRPRQDIAGAPYQDRIQSSNTSEIRNQAAHTAEFSKSLNQQREYRSKLLEGYWNKPHDTPVSTPQPQPAESTGAAVSQPYSSPRFVASDLPSSSQNFLPQQQNHPSQQQLNPPYSHQQNPMPSPIRQHTMQANAMRDPTQFHPHNQPHIARSSSSLSIPLTPTQPNPYGAYAQQTSSHSQQMWGNPPPQPQPSPAMSRMHTPHFSPSMGHPQIGQVSSPLPGPHSGQHPSQSPHPPHQMQPPPILQHQRSGGSLAGQQLYSGGMPGFDGQGPWQLVNQRVAMGMPGQGQNAGQFMPQSTQPSQGWPAVSQSAGGWSGY